MHARSGNAPVPIGEWIAALGAVCLLGTLFRPWYELNLPDEFLNQARGMAPQMGEFGSFFTQGLEELERQGPITVTAWQVFDSADVVLAALAAAALALEQLLDAQPAMHAALLAAVAIAGGGVMAMTAAEPSRSTDPPAPPMLDPSEVRVWHAS